MKSILQIILGLIIGLSFGYSYFHFIEMAKFRAAYWETVPILVDCTHGTLKPTRVEAAVDYWKEYNHNIAFVELNPSSKICSQDQIYGFIIIKNAVIDWPVLGETERHGTVDRKISSALITLDAGSANEPRLLEHELGHAFGYRHMDVKGHIMHSDYDHSGYDFWEKDIDNYER